MAQQSVLLAPQVTSVEEGLTRWNDATDPFDPDDPRHQQPTTAADTLKADNTQRVNVNKTNHPSILESTPNAPSPISGSPSASIRDSTSTHSLPVLQVTEPQHSPAVPQGPDHPSQSDDDGTTPVQRIVVSGASPPPPSDRGNIRSRSTIDGRSPSRLSGFFSHLIHRRDNALTPPGAVTNQGRTNTPGGSTLPSRESSPVPVPRPSTPPPPLPSPSLTELGLSLTVLTEHLSPSHFSTPPTSGAFLAPHYLLLCHAQGLDVLPLVSPPAPAPYALIRRVSFKSVVVMEHRGVLVAISGRRDGVRVYALDEIKKAVEWRLDVEIRREREKLRREEAKRAPLRDSASNDVFSREKISPPNLVKSSSMRSSPSTATTASRKGSHRRKAKTPPHTPMQPIFSSPPAIGHPPLSPPPSYMSVAPPPQPLRQRSTSSIRLSRGRSTSVNDVLRGTISRRGTGMVEMDNKRDEDVKADWMEESHSDDEAINVVAAGASGSQALDERTSSIVPVESTTSNVSGMDGAASRRVRPVSTTTLTPTGFRRATRPSELDLSRARTEPRPVLPPSPTPTLLTLRQALMASPPTGAAHTVNSMNPPLTESPIRDQDPDDDDENENRTPPSEPISFAQALLESRLPNLPPIGTRLPQQAILITQSHLVATGEEDVPSSPVSLNSQSSRHRQSNDAPGSRRRRRRWSVLDGILPGATGQPDVQLPTTPQPWESQDFRIREHPDQQPPSSSSPIAPAQSRSSDVAAHPLPVSASHHSRFFSRILGNPFSHRRSEDSAVPVQFTEHADGAVRKQGLTPPPAPAPKLEYVKLPGTKGSIMIKAVETSRKSFLAILCGDNGEKVELFAGTYRTALGLSRTFILPDSPRSLELQLQGDDLVEVFLVFSQNVFGLEPATVRVREVRLGRAERRAARRRARELQVDDLFGSEMDASPTLEGTANVNVRVGLSVPSSVSVTTTTEVSAGTTPLGGASPSASQPNMTQRPASGAALRMEDIIPATPQGPYTTFQQLSFSPIFPLASIVDEYIIPPTYPDFLRYRSVHEPEVNGNSDVDLSQIQFSPPGLPVPPVVLPSRWFYRDPKGVVHGPWLSSRMHAWYREALLPPDLPVRREEDTEFVLLKDLRQHCVDPSQPFGPASTRTAAGDTPLNGACAGKPLLPPISLLSQPRLFGPPSLFFSSRGGHSTTIVDGRGRSVLKDRFLWTPDEVDIDGQTVNSGRLGDVKRLEAFDLQGRSVLVAMRQGGFEAVELSDALLRPADGSRDVIPHYTAAPTQMNRRKIFTWRNGSPVSSTSSTTTTVTTLLRTSSRYSMPSKKSGAPGKSPARPESGHGDTENDHTRNEIMFLGRQDDNVYICERDGEAFRILRLSPFGPN